MVIADGAKSDTERPGLFFYAAELNVVSKLGSDWTSAFVAAADVEVAIVGDDELETLYRANDDDSEGVDVGEILLEEADDCALADQAESIMLFRC